MHPNHLPPWIRAGCVAAAAALVLSTAGCDDQPEECVRLPEGEFSFSMDPARADDPYTLIATVQSIEHYDGNPSVWVYHLATQSSGTVTLTLEDLGYSLPVEQGQSYRFDVHSVGGVPAAHGLRISDDEGVRFLAITDWLPNYSIFSDGYGTIGTGTLQVFFGDAGCDPRVDNSDCFVEIRNYRLEFLLGGTARTKLWNAQETRLNGWRIHALKSGRVMVKAECPEKLQQQISFFLERDGIRAS